jgi:hypothetical protein
MGFNGKKRTARSIMDVVNDRLRQQGGGGGFKAETQGGPSSDPRWGTKWPRPSSGLPNRHDMFEALNKRLK